MKWICVLAFAIAMGSMPALAASDEESEALGHLVQELESLKVLVDRAQQQADGGQRITFNYEALRADLRAVQVGVEQYRAGIRSQPREIAPVVGDYRR